MQIEVSAPTAKFEIWIQIKKFDAFMIENTTFWL